MTGHLVKHLCVVVHGHMTHTVLCSVSGMKQKGYVEGSLNAHVFVTLRTVGTPTPPECSLSLLAGGFLPALFIGTVCHLLVSLELHRVKLVSHS